MRRRFGLGATRKPGKVEDEGLRREGDKGPFGCDEDGEEGESGIFERGIMSVQNEFRALCSCTPPHGIGRRHIIALTFDVQQS